MRPRPESLSATWHGVLIQVPVEVSAEPLGVDSGGVREGLDHGGGRYEATPPRGDEVPDRDPVAGDDEVGAAVELAHDLAAPVP